MDTVLDFLVVSSSVCVVCLLVCTLGVFITFYVLYNIYTHGKFAVSNSFWLALYGNIGMDNTHNVQGSLAQRVSFMHDTLFHSIYNVYN